MEMPKLKSKSQKPIFWEFLKEKVCLLQSIWLLIPKKRIFSFLNYYLAKGEKYFYDMLTDLSNIENLTQDDFIDWGEQEKYVKAIGIGECAGVVIDLIATLFLESEEKIENAKISFDNEVYSSAIYHAYSSLVNSAKALLLAENKRTNTQAGIIKQFDEEFISNGKIDLGVSFSEFIYQIKKQAPSKEFAFEYIANAEKFLEKVKAFRTLEMIPIAL